jgi:hypothetical protein
MSRAKPIPGIVDFWWSVHGLVILVKGHLDVGPVLGKDGDGRVVPVQDLRSERNHSVERILALIAFLRDDGDQIGGPFDLEQLSDILGRPEDVLRNRLLQDADMYVVVVESDSAAEPRASHDIAEGSVQADAPPVVLVWVYKVLLGRPVGEIIQKNVRRPRSAYQKEKLPLSKEIS